MFELDIDEAELDRVLREDDEFWRLHPVTDDPFGSCSHGMRRDLCSSMCGPESVATVQPGRAVGGELATDCQLAGQHPERLTATQILDVVDAANHLVRWATALRTRMLGEFAALHPAGSHTAPPDADPRALGPVSRWLPDHIGMVLGIGREEARSMIAEARRFTEVLPATLAEWEAGRIDDRTATTIARATTVLDDTHARQVETAILPGAAQATRRQLTDRLRRAIIRADPDGARQRHDRANADRRMSISHGEDGMAALWLSGTAAQTEASWRCVDRLARAVGKDDQDDQDDPRTLDQKRVDIAHQLLQGTLSVTDLATIHRAVEGVLAAARDTPARDAATTGVTGSADSSTDTAAATDDVDAAVRTGARAGAEALDQAGTAARATGGIAGDTSDTTTLTATGTNDPTAIAPTVIAPIPAEVITEAVAQALAAKPDPNEVIGRKPLIQVVVGLDTLLGDDRPAHLVGHGTINALTARALAAGGVWARLVVDPQSGALLDYGRTTYHPPAALDDHVRARDGGTCRGPGCPKPIRDLDHHIPWGEGHDGPTSEANLHGYCRNHHKLKDAPGWRVISHPDGTLTWISPSGGSRTTRPYDYRPFIDPMPEDPMPEPPAPTGTSAGPAGDDETADNVPPPF